MRRSIWERIQEIINKHVIHGKWVRSVIALSCVVIFITTYVLIMPAVTLSGAATCGQEEHTHTGDCYETETELTCDKEEHTHSEDCYDEEGNLICGMEEHVHDDGCYTTHEVLVCGKEEHTHTDDCYPHMTTEEAAQEDTSSPAADAPEDEEETVTEEVSGETAATAETVVAEEPFYGELQAEGKDYTITVTCTQAAKLPADVSLKVKEITKKKEYNAYKSQMEEELIDAETTKVTGARFFDITLLDKDGNELHPEQGVTVLIETKDTLEQDEKVQICHFDEEKDKPVEVESREVVNETYEEENLGVEFEAESFSVYGVVYTVDFEYEDPETGEVYSYSLDGGKSVNLTDLLVSLGIKDEDEVEQFVAEQVEGVTFSNPELIRVSHKGNGHQDWLLESLRSFATEEVLTISLKSGSEIVIHVTDAQYTSDLNSLLTGITVKLNGETLNDGDTVTVDKNDKLDIHIELEENDFLQFMDDGTPMTYQLPDGVNLGEAFTRYITVNMGIDGKVYRNPITYNPDTNTITLTWNTKDPNFKKLTSTDNTKVQIDLSGAFNEDASHVDFGLDLDVDVEHAEHHDADISKTGQVFLPGANGNPYGNQPAIKYTVKVTSDGITVVNVNDTVEGSAVTLDTTNWTAVSNKGTTITPSFNEKGFSLNNQSLQDGEEVTITYWGKVDTSKIDNLLNVTYNETGNKVTLTGDNIPEKEVTHYEHEVGVNNLSKSSTDVSAIDENGLQTVTWKIVANSNPLESIGGSTITDRISYNSLGYMSYADGGITVVAKRADGTVVSNDTYDWNTEKLTKSETDNDKHWVFTIPDTNEALIYEITYKTVVDTTKFTGLTSAVNTSEGKPGKSSGSATVGVPESTDQPIIYTKKAVSVDEDEIVWNISVNIDKKDAGYSQFVLNDAIPSHAFGNIGYTDDIKSVSVEGLENTEWYAVSYEYGRINDNAWKESGDNTKPTNVILTFYKDGKAGDDVQNENGQNSTAHPGLNAPENRTLTVQVVTKNSEEWLKLAARDGIDHQDYLQHTNTAKINNLTPVSDTVSPMAKVVYKMRNGKVEVQKNDGTANSYTEVATPGGNQGEIVDGTRFAYPAYKFWVIVGGVTESNLEDGKIVIEDEFDSHFRILLDGEDKPTQYGYGTSPTSFNQRTPDAASGESFSWTQSDGKAVFTITNPSKNGDNYYPYYMVEYWLVPKSAEDFEAIKRLTMEEGGEKLFTNRASVGDDEAELDFEYEYKVIDKSSVSEYDPDAELTLEKYTIKINPDKMKILPEDSEEEYMTMTDTYSRNLSIDFGSIQVTAVDKEGNDRSSEVTWDYRNNVGTFTIPDETYVVITYSARVIGSAGSVQTISNTAYMEGHSDTVTSERVVDMSGGATAERVRVRLFKFAADHMEGGLDGAKFRLLDQDKNPVKDKNGNDVVFTTGIGYLNKYGVVNAAHDYVDYTVNETTGLYDTKVNRNDLNDEGKARWDAGTIANPTDDPEKLVTYGDLSAAGRNRLGISLYHGFAEIALDQKEMGIALKKERAYYLEEIETPVDENGQHYDKDFIKYSFLITDQADYSAPAGVYVYHNNDIMTVRNWPSEKSTLKIVKSFNGNVDLTEEQKNKVTFTLQKKNTGGEWEDYPLSIWDASANAAVESATFKYGDYGVKTDGTGDEATVSKGDLLFQNGIFTIEDIDAGTYRVIESNAVISDESGKEYSHTAEYLVDGQKQTVLNEEDGVAVTITEEDIENDVSHDVSITNNYFNNEYTIRKVSSDTAQVLGGAKFKIVKIGADGFETNVVTGLETNEDGIIDIQFNNNVWDASFSFEKNTLYYVVETAAPGGYNLPASPDKYYFYFSEDPEEGNSRWAPSIKNDNNPNGILPEGESATDLSVGYGSATISNKPDETRTHVEIDKRWVDSMGKDVTNTMTEEEAVNVTLYRTTEKLTSGTVIDGGDEENPKNAADVKTLTLIWGTQEMKLNFIPGDRIQVTLTAAGEDKIKPSRNNTDINYDTKAVIGGGDWEEASIKSLVLTTKSAGNNPTITFSDTNAFGLTAVNLEAETRVYKLTQADAEEITNHETVEADITLGPDNHWTKTINNLEITDTNGLPYFYYVVESGDFDNSSTSYDIGSKTITVTNTAPDELEVVKKWENVNGENVTNEKTDGSITYELYQVENPLAVGPYSGSGRFNIDINGLNTDGVWNHVKPVLKGNINSIQEGSKIQLEILADSASNQDLGGDISISNCTVVSDDITLFDVDMGTWTAQYHKRTIIVENVLGDLRISGIITTDKALDLTATVLEEPTNASAEWDDLVKNKMGEVTVTYDGATLEKASGFENLNFRVTPGTKHWSSLIYNLPLSGTKDGKKVNYTYYVVEKDTPVASNYAEPTYQVQGNDVENAVSELGGTVVIINKENEVPKGSVKITKIFEGIKADKLPEQFKIVASWTEGEEAKSVELTRTGEQPENVVLTGSGLTYTWTISEIPIGSEVTFTESGYDIAGYEVKINGQATASDVSAEPAKEIPGEAQFTNVYTPKTGEVKVTKVIGGSSNGADKTFSFKADLTPSSDITIDPAKITVENGNDVTLTPESPAEGQLVTVAFTITGAGTATIKGIPVGTTYAVTEVTGSMPDGWKQTGEIVYNDTTKTVALNDTNDEVTITNEEKDFTFYKEWTEFNKAIAWPTDTNGNKLSITVQIGRNVDGNADTYARTYVIDNSKLVDGSTIAPDGEAAPLLKVEIVPGEEGKPETYKFSLSGLDYYSDTGAEYQYFVKETAVPEGFKLGFYRNGAVTAGADESIDDGGCIVNQDLEAYVLPVTGGPGTSLIYLLGIALIVLAGGGYILRNRRLLVTRPGSGHGRKGGDPMG